MRVPIPISFNIEVSKEIFIDMDFKDHLDEIHQNIESQIAENQHKIATQVQNVLERFSSQEIERMILGRVQVIIANEIDKVINIDSIKKTAKAALKKATEEKIAEALGYMPEKK